MIFASSAAVAQLAITNIRNAHVWRLFSLLAFRLFNLASGSCGELLTAEELRLVRRKRSRLQTIALMLHSGAAMIRQVQRIVKKSRSFQEADRWDIRQNLSLTPEQRIQIAHALRKRAYPANAKDVREWHRAR